MQFLDRLFGPHAGHCAQALSKAAQRHTLLAANLANVNTPGYKRRDMDFAITLENETGRQSALEFREKSNGRSGAGATSLRLDGNNVDLEFETSEMAEMEVRFQALSQMTSSYFSGLKNVIREGR